MDASTGPQRKRHTGFDYVHAAIDDHSRVAYAEIHPDEPGATCAGFLDARGGILCRCGITRIERVMTDNAFAYRRRATSRPRWRTWAPATC